MASTALIPGALETELGVLARRYRKANGVGMQVLNLVGGQAENLLEYLPDPAKDRLEEATLQALRIAAKAAAGSRDVVPDQARWLNTTVTTAMGAAGGFGGLPTALAELPVTTTVLLRAIQGIAADHGFDTSDETIQAECIQVFAAAGPLEADDGADLGFLATRVTLTGNTLQSMISAVAPKLATVLGQKLAAQTVPVLGAVAGAATNYAYTSYYQEIAHVHFGLKRLALTHGVDRPVLVGQLRERVELPSARRA